MAVVLNDSMKDGRYTFFAKVFNLPSVKTVSNYGSISGNAPDGVMYDALKIIEDATKDHDDDWKRHVCLKWDACHIAEKVMFNM